MSEMVDRVAKAILVRSFGAGSTDAESVAIEYARAAIAAMHKALEDYDVEDWPAVFDKALK